MSVIPAWITENDSYYRPTEIFVPVRMKIGPVWKYQEQRGGWFAALESGIEIELAGIEYLWECEHAHPTQDEAWECAEAGAKAFARLVLEQTQ